MLPFLGPYVDESHMWKRRFPYEEYNKRTVTGNQDSKLIVTALKAGALDFVVKGAQGEFMPLMKATFESAVRAMRLRRGVAATALPLRNEPVAASSKQ